jgi:TetR/AcrR family fatty acid metabolism transcriptional regulator
MSSSFEASSPPRNPEKVEAIVKAAFKAIAEKGYARVSMRDIASEAGVNKSILHYYFKDKDELISAVFHSLHERFREIAAGAVSVPTGVEDRLSEGFGQFLVLTENEPEWFLVIMDLTIQAVQNPGKREEVYSLSGSLREIVADGFREAREAGEIKANADENVLAAMVIAMVNGLALQYIVDREAVDFARAYAEFESMLSVFLRPTA